MYCTHCGAKIDDNARFCPECGKSMSSSQPRVPEYTPEPTSTRRRENTSFKKPQFKKEGSGGGSKVFFKILAVAIVGLLAYLGYDYFTNGVGGADKVANKIKPYFHLKEEDDQLQQKLANAKVYTASIGGGDSVCVLDNGIRVEFLDHCAPETPTKLTVRDLGKLTIDGTEAIVYDFKLDGQSQFDGFVNLSIPLDEKWNKDLVFAQNYNEEAKEWEPIYSEITPDGRVQIKTTHFSFKSLFEGKKKEIISFDGKPSLDHPLMTTKVNKEGIDYFLKKGGSNGIDFSKFSDPTDKMTIAKGLDIAGLYSTLGDYSGQIGVIAFMSPNVSTKFFSDFSTACSYFGLAMTVGKLSYLSVKSGDPLKVIKQNPWDVASVTVSGASAAFSNLGTCCNLVGICLFLGSQAHAQMTRIDTKNTNSHAEYAYNTFNENYITFKFTKNWIQCGYIYYKNLLEEAEGRGNRILQNGEVRLTLTNISNYSSMWEPLVGIADRFKNQDINLMVESFYTQIASQFWIMAEKDPNTLHSYLKNTRSGVFSLSTLDKVYTAPTKDEIKLYKARYKSALYRVTKEHLSGLFQYQSENLYRDLHKSAVSLSDQLNKTLSFVLKDKNNKKQFKTDKTVYLSDSKDGNPIWYFSEKNEYCINCTQAMYLFAKCPRYIVVKEGDKIVNSFSVSITKPVTYITLEGQVEEEEDVLDLLSDGDDTDGIIDIEGINWDQSDNDDMETSLSGGGGAVSDEFPGGDGFNGLNIGYTISGAQVSGVEDHDGFTESRTITGSCSSGRITITGHVENNWGASVGVTVTIRSGTDNDEQTLTLNKETGKSKNYSVSIPVTKSSKDVTFSISVGASYGNGESRGLCVSGTFQNIK